MNMMRLYNLIFSYDARILMVVLSITFDIKKKIKVLEDRLPSCEHFPSLLLPYPSFYSIEPTF